MSSNTNSTVTAPRGTNNVTNLDEVRQARAKAKRTVDAQDATDDVLTDTAANSLGDSLVDLSDSTADDRHGNRRFDAKKVARLKAEIASGEYKIDPASIANKFIEHDRNQ